jgi:hypothetical protein
MRCIGGLCTCAHANRSPWILPESNSCLTEAVESTHDAPGSGSGTRSRRFATALIALAVLSVTAGPDSAQAATPAPLVPFTGLAPFGQLYIYPKDGASYSQQATDYYECDVWAVKQTGFDPTLENGGEPPDVAPARQVQYLRAEATCLETRGYTVKIVRAAS